MLLSGINYQKHATKQTTIINIKRTKENVPTEWVQTWIENMIPNHNMVGPYLFSGWDPKLEMDGSSHSNKE